MNLNEPGRQPSSHRPRPSRKSRFSPKGRLVSYLVLGLRTRWSQQTHSIRKCGAVKVLGLDRKGPVKGKVEGVGEGEREKKRDVYCTDAGYEPNSTASWAWLYCSRLPVSFGFLESLGRCTAAASAFSCSNCMVRAQLVDFHKEWTDWWTSLGS